MLKRTPLYEEHLKLGAKITPFAGWEMPLSYKGIIQEHQTVRFACGIFDIGHMGVLDIEGVPGMDFLKFVTTNDTSLLAEGECQYSLLCNDQGGVIDDILVYRLKDGFRLVVNASNTDAVLAHFEKQAGLFEGVKINHRTDISMLSVQGPQAKKYFPEIEDLPHNHGTLWRGVFVSRTGYTGEDGFELFAQKDQALKFWRDFIKAGISPCGLGARDTLRLEAGLPLYGHEYNLNISPLEAGYSWAVKFNKANFIGKSALLKKKAAGLPQKLVGLKFSEKAIPREGFEVWAGDQIIGKVTSGTFSPTLQVPIALAYLKSDFAQPGRAVGVKIRDQVFPAVVSSKKLL